MTDGSADRRSLAGECQSFAGGYLSSHYLLKGAVVAVAYCLTGALGLLLAIPPGYATAVWPPSGVALAGLLWWGPRVWPGIWLGSFLVNVWVALTAPNAESSFTGLTVAASIGLGSTLQALLGAFLLQRWVGAARLFERGTTILAFAAVEALSCLLAPTWGLTTLSLAGVVDWAAYFDSWRTWWLGDLVGVLIVTPVVLTWRQLFRVDGQSVRSAEGIGSLALLVGITAVVFVGPSPLANGEYPLAFVPLLCLVWLAFRFGPGGVAIATALLSGIAVFATSHGAGPFARESANESLLLLQSFIGLSTLTGLTLAAAVNGHKQAEIALQQLAAELAETNRQLGTEILLHQQAEENARQLALTDELTGLYNRRGFLLLADQKWRIARRLQGSCLLVYVDLDGLKQVNDTQGHAAGDALIVDATRVLNTVFRESDLIARLAGDEFAVLTLVDHPDAAPVVSKRLEASIADFNRQAGLPYRLSMSFGIQTLPSAGNVPLGDLLARADQAMYVQTRERKQRG